MTYVPRLGRDAFVRMPNSVVLPGSPSDYDLSSTDLTSLAHEGVREAVRRIVIALQQHGRWDAIKEMSFVASLGLEIDAHNDARHNSYVHSSLLADYGEHGIKRIMEGVRELTTKGWLKKCERDRITILWVTPVLVDRLSPYRQPV